MTRTAMCSIATIDQFIAQVGNVKTASDGTTPLSEPGSIGGETSHPVKKVDDRLAKAKEGERSAENSRDVKADQGAPSVEGKPEASTKSAASIFGLLAGFAKKADGSVSTPGSAADDHISTTTKVAPTGEDPSNETNSAKAGKEDKKQGGVGGTSHPASTENDSLDGHKYANDSLEKLATDMRTVGNNLLAQIHNLYNGQGHAQHAPPQTKTAATNNTQNTKQAGAVDPQLAYYAGQELAALISGHGLNKQATDNMVRNAIADVVKQASDDADGFITYARSFFKQAEEGEEMDPSAGGGGEDPAAAAAAAGGGGGGDPMAGGGGGGEEEAMMAALGGGAGGDPSGGMGGGGGGGGDPSDEEAAQLALVLEQLGVTPEELEQALQEQQAGGGAGGGMGGGMPGMGGGGDPMAAMGGAGGGGMETQANAGGGKRNAGTQKIASNEISNHIREIITRSRTKR